MSEFSQLETTVVWATADGDAVLDADSRKQLEEDYESFVAMLPEDFDAADYCLTGGDPEEQFAHDYIMTRMRHGVGFWETADWEAEMGERLTDMCHTQGDLETYEEDGVVYVY